jgi:hypothetical protein
MRRRVEPVDEVVPQRSSSPEAGVMSDGLDAEAGRLQQSLRPQQPLLHEPLPRRQSGLGAEPPGEGADSSTSPA